MLLVNGLGLARSSNRTGRSPPKDSDARSPAPAAFARDNKRNTAQGPSAERVSGGVPSANATASPVFPPAPARPGHVTAAGRAGTSRDAVMAVPSSVSTADEAFGSSAPGVTSNRTTGRALPAGKNRSRMVAARWNCATSAGVTGGTMPSTGGLSRHGRTVVSTYGLSSVLK